MRSLGTCVLILGVAFASAQNSPSKATFDILGLKIGMDLEEARSLLKGKGTAGGRQSRGGAYKEAWTLETTEYQSVAYKADGKGRLVWISGWVRKGNEMKIEALGFKTGDKGVTPNLSVRTVQTPIGSVRLVARGAEGKACLISLFEIERAAPPP